MNIWAFDEHIIILQTFVMFSTKNTTFKEQEKCIWWFITLSILFRAKIKKAKVDAAPLCQAITVYFKMTPVLIDLPRAAFNFSLYPYNSRYLSTEVSEVRACESRLQV